MTNSGSPGREGLSPTPLKSTRTERSPSIAHSRASSTHRRAGPMCGSVATPRKTIVGPETFPGTSVTIPNKPVGPRLSGRSTICRPPGPSAMAAAPARCGALTARSWLERSRPPSSRHARCHRWEGADWALRRRSGPPDLWPRPNPPNLNPAGSKGHVLTLVPLRTRTSTAFAGVPPPPIRKVFRSAMVCAS